VTAAQLLEQYLPAKDGRCAGERIQAIAGRALADGIPKIERRLARPLRHDERADAYSWLVLVGVGAAGSYRPDLDKGTGTLATDVLFGRFAYLRMRQRLVDWERKQYGDARPGRTKIPALVPLDEIDRGSWDGGFDLVDEALSAT
jgi:hypothetical protein